MDIFSTPQLVGYLSFALGITAFLQRSDRRLKAIGATQSLTYAVHYALLGNHPAAASALISSTRNLASLNCRSLILASGFVVVNLIAGFYLVTSPIGWLTVLATCGATVAMFTLTGIPLRLALLGSTACWLINGIVSRSIGGAILEATIAVINVTTTFRLLRERSDRPLTD